MTDPALVVFASLLACTGGMRIAELAVSSRRAGRRAERVVREAWLFPLMALLHAGLVAGPLVEVVVLGRPFLPLLSLAAGLVLLGATALRVWTLRTLGRSWNVRVVVPDDPAVVSGGPYAWIRHPNYLVVILEIAALPLLHTAWIAAVSLSALNAFVLYHRVRTEEAALSQLPTWRDAMASKKRFIPGVF
jgi:methyltransferase